MGLAKIFILTFLMSFSLLAIDSHRVIMHSISEHAIRIGTGDDVVFAFVDPICPKSRAYISLISEREDLQEKKSFYIFLYRLKKFESDKLIQYILQSTNRLQALQNVMVKEEEIDLDDFIATKKTLDVQNEIASAGKKIKITRRPFLLLYDKGSKYCKVSSGVAPCMEEKVHKDKD